MRILIMTDSLFIPTGLGRVGRELALGLSKRGHSIGYLGLFHRDGIPFNVPNEITYWHTNNNLYGSDIFDQVVLRFQPDIVLTISDLWNLGYITNPAICRTRNYFQWCSYISVDGEPLNGGVPPALIPIIKDIDIPVAYTHYAKNAILKSVDDLEIKSKMRVIYHGVNPEIYKPIDYKYRQQIRDQFRIGNRFLFLTVSRNQTRKNIPELLRAWKKFSEIPEIQDNVILWPHMFFSDPMGWEIDDLLKIFKLNNKSIMYYDQIAHSQSELCLLPEEELARLYQIADAFILVSGEGFGLPIIEAMASRLPCILLDCASSHELGKDGCAELIPSRDISWTGLHLTQRILPNIDDIIESMNKVYSNISYRNEIAEKGYQLSKKNSWDQIINNWHSLFIDHEVPFFKSKELIQIT